MCPGRPQSGGGAGKDLTFIVGLYDRIAKGPKSEQARWGKGFYRHFNGSTASGFVAAPCLSLDDGRQSTSDAMA